jgi:hypothetical protein
MATRVGDILKRRALESFVGRRDEKAALLDTLEEKGPLVVFVHGIAGIGKSSLLEAFSEEAREHRATVVRLDCRSIEPTERGFIQELGTAIGSEVRTADEAAERLGRLGQRVVFALDTYELFRLMDTWLRLVFIPTLPDNVRVVLCGREAPVSAWVTSPQWQGLFRSISLGPLKNPDALEFLSYIGVKEEDARRINRLTRGHPLALRLCGNRASRFPPGRGYRPEDRGRINTTLPVRRARPADAKSAGGSLGCPLCHTISAEGNAPRRGTTGRL